MTDKIKDIQKETVKDVLKKLKEHHKCLLVRPTGFGKTKIAVDIVKKYKHAVFLYPTNNIAMAVKGYDTKGLDLHLFTYSKLRSFNKSQEEFEKVFSEFNHKNSIIVMDEAHFIGAPATSKAIIKLMQEVCPKANFLGITATPNRTDKLDIKWHFFDGITAYYYGLSNAFKDNIFKKPYYVYTPLDGTEFESDFLRRIDNMEVSESKKNQLRSNVKKYINPEKLNIENLHEIILNNLDKFKNDKNYYKFILFFTTFNSIHSKKEEIVTAFKKAFPKCKINVIIVSSESHRYRLNLNAINGLKPRNNTIDLIFNVNMLTFGYHVNDITGIMMFRSTVSNIMYTQQVGRCLSVMQDKSTIIFDFVENLNKLSPNSIVYSESKSEYKINSFDIVLSMDDIILDERTKNLLEIERLINNAVTEEFEEEIVFAYKEGLIDMCYAINKLELHNKNDFMKVLERYT